MVDPVTHKVLNDQASYVPIVSKDAYIQHRKMIKKMKLRRDSDFVDLTMLDVQAAWINMPAPD